MPIEMFTCQDIAYVVQNARRHSAHCRRGARLTQAANWLDHIRFRHLSHRSHPRRCRKILTTGGVSRTGKPRSRIQRTEVSGRVDAVFDFRYSSPCQILGEGRPGRVSDLWDDPSSLRLRLGRALAAAFVPRPVR